MTPTDIHLPPKIGVSHLHIFGEGVFCRKTINDTILFFSREPIV
ncbi:fibronectin [Bacillus cereus]|nr:fibronectin [Bacillus cereus]